MNIPTDLNPPTIDHPGDPSDDGRRRAHRGARTRPHPATAGRAGQPADGNSECLRLTSYELSGRDTNTVRTVRCLVDSHIVPNLGARKLVDLSADDVDRWIGEKSTTMVTSTLRSLLSILRRAVTRAQARDRVKRNVVLLCDCPVGKGKGRPSKALTLSQAEAVLSAAEKSSMRGYVVVALLTPSFPILEGSFLG